MRIYAEHFMFAGKSTKSFGYTLCNFEEASSQELNSVGSMLETTTAKPIGYYKWNYFGQQYTEPITFRLQIVKINGQPVPANEKTMIASWLLRNDGFKKFQFDDPDYYDVIYYAKAQTISEISVAGYVRGFEIEFTTNSPFGYSPLLKKRFHVTVPNQQFRFFNQSDEFGYIYPKMKVTFHEDCDFSLLNQIENRELVIKGCQEGEIITLDNELKTISTTSHTHKIYDNFNWKWFRLFCNENNRNNTLTITGNSIVELEYQLIRKLGVE